MPTLDSHQRAAAGASAFKECGARVVIESDALIDGPGNMTIGNDVWIDRQVTLRTAASSVLTIGAGTHIGHGSALLAFQDIHIGNSVQIGPFVRVVAMSHTSSPMRGGPAESTAEEFQTFSPSSSTIEVRDEAVIDEGAIIHRGVIIGHRAYVCAGAVVLRDVPPSAVVAGNPARVLRYRGARSAQRVLVIGGGPFQLPMIRTALSMGFETVVVDRDHDAPGLAIATHPVAVDTTNIAGVVEVSNRYRVDAVVTAATDRALTAVSAVSASRDLSGHPPESIQTCRDKLATYRVLRGATLPVPITVPISRVSDATAALSYVGGYPCVVKPRSAAGGRGVTIVETAEEFAAALERALPHASSGQGVLLQAFVPGRSVGVEAIFWQGRIVRGFVLDDQYQDDFVSPIGHSLPSTLSPELQAKIVSDVERFGQALGLVDGAANFDLRLVGEETFLIECNARLGGSSITDLVRFCYGVDLSAVAIEIALGRAPTSLISETPPQPTAARIVILRGRGRLLFDETELDRLRASEGVRILALTAAPGDPVSMVVEQWSIIATVVCSAQSPEQAIRRTSEVATTICAMVKLEN